MTFTFLHATNQGAPVLVPQIGLEMLVRVPPEATGGVLTVIETTNAPGWSELLDRHAHRGDLLGYRGAMIQDLDLDLDARAFPQTMTQNCDLVVISASLGGRGLRTSLRAN